MLCLSVNDAVLHGLPHDYALRDGDVLSMDIAVGIDGWVADSARTVIVGTPAEEDLRLMRATEEALVAGIAAAQPGNRLGDISAAIAAVATATVTRSTPSSAATASAAPCTRTRTCRTTAGPAAA